MEKTINLAEKLASFDEPFSPRIAGTGDAPAGELTAEERGL